MQSSLLCNEHTYEYRVEDGETDEELVERLLEVRSTEDGDGGAVEKQPAHADENREDPLENCAPELRRSRHPHTAGQVGRSSRDIATGLKEFALPR